uniref:Odorant receptor n=1 Tax=Anopheles maculatus TaxID=74869 RepID=A0A182SP96_9DIPT
MDTDHYQPGDDFIELVQRSSYWLRTMATTMGIWPSRYVTIRQQWYRRLYYFMLLMHWLNTYLQTEFFFRNLGNLGLVVQGLCSFVSITTTGIKVMRMHAYEEEIVQLWEALEDATFLKQIRFLRKTDRGTIFERINKLLSGQWKEVQLNLRFYTFLVALVASNYSILPACSNLYNQYQVYNTYYPLLEPVKRQSPLFELLFCSESLSGYTTCAGVVAFDGLYVVMVLYATSLMPAIYQLFQFCWYGQRLQNEWELCEERFKSSHHILLLYSQRQIDMRAWSFSAMSLETFSTIIRSAASYFTVLQTLAEE